MCYLKSSVKTFAAVMAGLSGWGGHAVPPAATAPVSLLGRDGPQPSHGM